MKRSKQESLTLHADIVPHDHRCLHCKRNNSEVNFYVLVNKYSKTVSKLCNHCRKKGIKTKKTMNRIIEIDNLSEPIRLSVKHRIDIYFKRKHY